MDIQDIKWPGWEVTKLIGSGSFGSVYEIKRSVFGKTERAALKVISIPQNKSDIEELYNDGFDDETITARFHSYLEDIANEYSLMLEMKGHTNVVYCDDFQYVQHDDDIGWDIFIKMELLTPLTKSLPKQISEDSVIRVGKDICNALILCKERNIVHRDIKPQNIFVSQDGNYKLGDFGIAKTAEHTTGGTKIGTYKYMAPEVYNNHPYGSAADIYSLGMVMYWMLNERRTPFLPLPPEVPTISMEDKARQRRFMGEAIPEPAHGSEELKRIVLKACAFDPKERYSNAREMLQDLQNIPERGEPAAEQPHKTVCSVEPTINDAPETPQNPEEDKTEGIFSSTVKHTAVKAAAGQNALSAEDSFLTEDEKTVGAFDDLPKKSETKPDRKKTPKRNTRRQKTMLIAAACLAAVILGIFLLALVNRPREDKEITVFMISTGSAHTVGVKMDGTVIACGDNSCSQCDVSRWSDIAAVSAGTFHTVGLKMDGTVVACGDSSYGQCDISGWTDIISVSACVTHTVGVKTDGTVVACGDNSYGQCDVSGWTEITTVSAGTAHTVGMKTNGMVVACGDNSCGQCDVSDWTDIIAISTGAGHTIGLKRDGTVVACGDNSYGQCDVSGWTDIAVIDTEANHTIGVKKDGTVVACGDNSYGQCDVSGWTDIYDVSTGVRHTVGLKRNGTVVVCGDKRSGQCDASDWVGPVAATGDVAYQIIDMNEFVSVIVGTWIAEDDTPQGIKSFTFNSDGTGSQDTPGASCPFTYTVDGTMLNISIDGVTESLTFFIIDNTMTLFIDGRGLTFSKIN